MDVPPKEWYHKQGIPVGVGTPGGDGPKEPTEEEMQDQIEQQEDEDIAQSMAMNDSGGGGYVQHQAPGDKARILQYIHTNLPLQQQSNGKMSGEIPEDMFYAFYGWLAHNSSLGNMTEQEIAEKRIELDIQEMEVMFAMKRKLYTPKVNSDIRNAKNLCDIKLTQNKYGDALYLAHAEVSEDLRAYKVMRGKQPGRMETLGNKVRGR